MLKGTEPTWRPGPDDYDQVFRAQNPWHFRGPKVPEELAPPIKRALAKFLPHRLKTDKPRRFQLILGARRVGKTVAMHQTIQALLAHGMDPWRIWYLRLDNPHLMELPLDDLVKYVLGKSRASKTAPAYLFLDEIVYANNWRKWLKDFYDDVMPIHLAASSSSTAALRDGASLESGAGRWEEQYLSPCLFYEYLELIRKAPDIPVTDLLDKTIHACIEQELGVSHLVQCRHRYLITGGFPELLLFADQNPDRDEINTILRAQAILRDQAVQRSIYMDIPQAFGIDSPQLLERLLYTLAGQVAGILSPNNIGQALGMAQNTFDRYLYYLEACYLVFTLSNYAGSEKARQKRGRKLYFVDCAVRNAALQRGIAPLEDPSEMGLLLENLVASHLHALGQISQVRLYHWRDKSDEVDLVYDHPKFPLAFEISTTGRHHRKGLLAFIERFPRFKNRCYLVAPNASPVKPEDGTDAIGTIPLDLLLLAIGAQAEWDLRRRLGVPRDARRDGKATQAPSLRPDASGNVKVEAE